MKKENIFLTTVPMNNLQDDMQKMHENICNNLKEHIKNVNKKVNELKGKKAK